MPGFRDDISLRQVAIGLEHLQLGRILMAVWGSNGNKTSANTKYSVKTNGAVSTLDRQQGNLGTIYIDGKGEKEREGLRTQFKIRLRQRKATSISRFKEQCNHSEGNQMLSAFKPCAGLNQTQKLEERGEYASSAEAEFWDENRMLLL